MNRKKNNSTVVFIDSKVENYIDLIAGIDTATKVVILDSSHDGVTQITHSLQDNKYTEIHLISHGSPGCLYLGDNQLSLDTLNTYEIQLRSWFDDGDATLLIYGCNVAAGDAGTEFLDKLQQFTGAEIAATKTLTGDRAFGGDWQLETTTTAMNFELAIASSVRDAYQGVLAEFIVTTANDENDGDVDGDDLSLREAIVAANNTPGEDTITFAENVNQIDLTEGTLLISDSVVISNSDADSLTINGGKQDFAVITIDDGTPVPTANVAIEGVTITGGNNEESGGGIRNLENLQITNSVVTGNTSGKDGGGIFNLIGTATVTNTLISDNSAAYGGGISNYLGATALENSTVTGNTAGKGGGIYNYAGATAALYTVVENNSAITGGGIANYNGTVAAVASVISGNLASENGGGLYNEEGEVSVTLSDVSDNTAGKRGGGIASEEETSITSVANSIISGNTADFGGGLGNYLGAVSVSASTISGNTAGTEGGGLSNYFGISEIINSTVSGNAALSGGGIGNFNGQTNVAGSTVADNTALYGSGIFNYYAQTVLASTIVAANNGSPDILGDFFVSQGNNLIGDGGDVDTLVDGENNDQVGTTENPIDPLLGELQDNGGLTPTQALLKGSPAIDAGGDLGLDVDQRGGDFIRPIGQANDIGAFEVQDPQATAGDDVLIGSAVDNIISAREGNDAIFGLEGRDILNGDDGDDTIEGGADGDRITGGKGNDLLFGQDGDDAINGSSGDDIIEAGEGEDRVNGNSGNDTILGGLGRDTIDGNTDDDIIDGGDGNDYLRGGAGIDILLGAGGNDTISGGNDTDTLDGGEGSDLLKGNDGDDFIFGGNDRDKLSGGNGNDIIVGGDGNDLIAGGDGLDTLQGDEGEDIFILQANLGTDIIVDFTHEIDKFKLSDELSFGSLSFEDDNDIFAVAIKDTSNGGDIVAIVEGISAADLSTDDFIA